MRAFLFSVCRSLRWGVGLAPLAGCTDPYLPEAVSSPPSYLVVDGYLNPAGVSTVKLSRTFAISASSAPPVEAKATVFIEDEAGARTGLRESPAGTYASPALTLSAARKYRLRVTTQAGKEYTSAYVPVKLTPPIDQVAWRADANGLNVYVSAHDPANATQYYRWETDETWEIRPPYSPTVEYVNRVMRDIVVPYPRVCYGNEHSTTVQLAQTTAQTQDVVSDFRLRQLPATTERLYSRYSILVQQYALTKEEFAYWELLRKNTESIGSLFDPQPAQLTGNVRCLSDPAEPVLGFVAAHSLVEKRIFVARRDLPPGFPIVDGYERCIPADTVELYPKGSKETPAQIIQNYFGVSGYLPINAIYRGGPVVAYSGKSRDCIDCRTRGTAVKPLFW